MQVAPEEAPRRASRQGVPTMRAGQLPGEAAPTTPGPPQRAEARREARTKPGRTGPAAAGPPGPTTTARGERPVPLSSSHPTTQPQAHSTRVLAESPAPPARKALPNRAPAARTVRAGPHPTMALQADSKPVLKGRRRPARRPATPKGVLAELRPGREEAVAQVPGAAVQQAPETARPRRVRAPMALPLRAEPVEVARPALMLQGAGQPARPRSVRARHLAPRVPLRPTPATAREEVPEEPGPKPELPTSPAPVSPLMTRADPSSVMRRAARSRWEQPAPAGACSVAPRSKRRRPAAEAESQLTAVSGTTGGPENPLSWS